MCVFMFPLQELYPVLGRAAGDRQSAAMAAAQGGMRWKLGCTERTLIYIYMYFPIISITVFPILSVPIPYYPLTCHDQT